MFNQICAPEMSFDEERDNEPHAYVSYAVDGEKEAVPISFISKFPYSWRESKGYDRHYLYKVFWSPTENDSPGNMLKRAPQIPVYENCSLTKAGYYRAAVVEVAETLRDLQSKMEKKRVSVPTANMTSSFDQSSQKGARRKPTQDNDTNQRVVKRKAGGKEKVSQVNKIQAQLHNVEDFRDEILAAYPQLNSDHQTIDTNSEAEDNPSSKFDCVSTQKHHELASLRDSDKMEIVETNEGSTKSDINVSKSPKLHREKSHALPSAKDNSNTKKIVVQTKEGSTKSGITVSKSPKSHGEKSSVLPSAKDNSNTKKIVVQTKEGSTNSDITVRKFKMHTEKSFVVPIATDDSNTKKIVVETKEGLKNSASRSAKKMSQIFCDTTSTDSDVEVDHKRFKMDPNFTPRKYRFLQEQMEIFRNTNKRLSDLNLKHQENMFDLQKQNQQLLRKVANLEEEIKTLSDKVQSVKGDSETGHSITKSIATCAPKESDVAEPKRGVQRVLFKECSLREPEASYETLLDSPEGFLSEDPILMCETSMIPPVLDDFKNPLILCPGREIEPDVWKLISTVPGGDRKDLQFIKDLSVAAFGPEVLATSSIKGTAKGGVKGRDRVKREALDSTVLDAIIDQLAIRIAREEGKTVEAVRKGKHRRLDSKRIFPAIRDIQKKLRREGYGEGIKSNNVTLTLLKAASND